MATDPLSRTGTVTMCLVLAALAACSTKDSVLVEHIKYNPANDMFEMASSTVTTFRNRYRDPAGEQLDGPYDPDIGALQGEHVVVRGGGRMLLNLCRTADANAVTREDFYRLGIITESQPVQLQLGRRILDGAYFGTEHDSIAMLSAYVNFDNAYSYFHDVVKDDSPASTTRAAIAFFGELSLGCGNGQVGVALPVSTVDNAAFVGTADMFIILRDAMFANGLELGTNPGVAAHEFGHRVFQHNVYYGESGFRMLALSFLGSQKEKDELCVDEVNRDGRACKASATLLKGMDEGTSDIFAYAITGKPGFFFDRSMKDSAGNPNAGTEDQLRDLSRKPAPPPSEELSVYTSEVVQFAVEGKLQFYRLGTLWSRAFYSSIVEPTTGREPGSEVERWQWAHDHYAPAVQRAERKLGEDFTTPAAGRKYTFRFDPRQYIRRYIEAVSVDRDTGLALPRVRDAVCQQMCNSFGAETALGGQDFDQPVNNVPAQCAGTIGQNPNTLLGVFPCVI